MARVIPSQCRFTFSADLNVLVRCRVDRLLPAARAEELIADEPLDISVALLLDGEVFRTVQSSQAVFDASPKHGVFRPKKFVFAVKTRDLPRQSSFVITLHGRGPSSVTYRGVLPLFGPRAALRQGRQWLAMAKVDPGAAPETEVVGNRVLWAGDDWAESSNEALLKDKPPALWDALRLARTTDLYDRGWLPVASPGFEGSEDFFARSAREALEGADLLWLAVQLPVFAQPVIFGEAQYGQDIEIPTGVLAAGRAEDAVADQQTALNGAGWLLEPLRSADSRVPGERPRSFKCFVDYDAEARYEHPAVLKALRLARSSRASRMKDKDVRPNADELRTLNELIRRPRRQFSIEEKHLLFRFRWSLTDQPGALTKFLHAVDWSDLDERQHAIELLDKWSQIDIDDALELLSKDFRGIREVRRHAVARLERASDEDLQLYLLQLVQALRYEPIAQDGHEEDLSLVAAPTPTTGGPPEPPALRRGSSGPSSDAVARGADAQQQRCALMWFLIRRAVGCGALATLFHWYVVAETDDRERGALFDRVRQHLLEALGESAADVRRMLERQVALRRQLLWCVQCGKVMKRDRMEKKVERFRAALASQQAPEDAQHRRLDLVGGLEESIPLPVDPSVSMIKVIPDQSFLLKSAMNPAVLTCQVRRTGDDHGETTLKKIMVKEGDDLRQDQLILQLIILMDSILKKYGLDLQLTPYQVIALSTNDGIIEFVPDACNLSSVLKDHNHDIQQFFRAHHPAPAKVQDSGDSSERYGPHNSYGIQPEVLENFIRSSAGYCVITYILGIGDRHLDNLMITRDGRLFHIDFGFILGKDPKPFPPPMRICKEMVEGMGGNNSPGYQSFRSKCCQAYKILRRHAKLIINLLYLMTDSGIKDLCGDPQFAILKVEQKFQALMDDEQAEEHFLSLIDESVGALFPVVMEKLHRLAIAMQ